VLGGKARAVLHGRSHVEPDDIRAVVHPVLRHRLIANFNAEADGVTTEDLIDRLLEHVSPDGTDAETEAELGVVMR
jgi:MoxR-like ATPase